MAYHRKRFAAVMLLSLILLSVFSGTAFAAEPEEPEQPEISYNPTIVDPEPVELAYPAEVRASQKDGIYYLEKVYYLSVRDNPAKIPREPFDREGRHYTLLDILKNDLSETDTKEYIEIITLESDSKELEKIIPMLEPALEVSTEDGYSGVLKPDYTTITVEASGYGNSSWTASATRTYPNLSDADVSLIPKTTEDSGRTLTLANVDWQEGNTDYVDGAPLAVRYTAVATYTTTVNARYATGYTVTVDYGGEVTKTSCDTIIYTAVFAAENASQIETSFEPVPEETAEPQAETTPEPDRAIEPSPDEQDAKDATKHIAILIVLAIVLVGLIGFVVWQGIKRYKAKRGEYLK